MWRCACVKGEGAILLQQRMQGAYLQFWCYGARRYHRVCDAWPPRSQTYGYLPSRRALPLRPILVSHPAEDRRLSWPEWLVTYQDDICSNGHRSGLVTGLDVEWNRWCIQRRHYDQAKPPPRGLEAHARTCLDYSSVYSHVSCYFTTILSWLC